MRRPREWVRVFPANALGVWEVHVWNVPAGGYLFHSRHGTALAAMLEASLVRIQIGNPQRGAPS